VDIEVVTTTANGSTELPARTEKGTSLSGVPVRYFPLKWPRRFFAASRLKEALHEDVGRYDLVHVHGLWNVPAWLAVNVARHKRVPYVISPRGMLDPGSFSHHRVRKEICFRLHERNNLRSAAFLHATSEAEKDAIQEWRLGVEVHVLANGVTPPTHTGGEDFRGRWCIDREAPLIVYLGRLHPTKRIDLLLAAFDRVRALCSGAVLVVAGREDGVAWSTLNREPSPAVRWLGDLTEVDKWALLSEASALVLCSDSESFGLCVLEALAVGVPVVVTQTCPWKEVEVRGCGFWVEQNVGSISQAVSRLLANTDEARSMGMKGQEYVRERFGWPAIAQKMEEFYEDAVRKTPRDRAT
jgi:glycosyltransferase involved in cell wall biosynthesis